MCTLIIGQDVLGPGTAVAAANRDEDPSRPSDPPAVLREEPRLVGGRDRRAGGTWLAIRERRALVAMLNRREGGPPASGGPAGTPRSRGLLTLDVAGVASSPGSLETDDLSAAARALALGAVREARYAPFSLAFVAPGGSWVMMHDGGVAPRIVELATGWHAVTHADLDDPGEPRTARILGELSRWKPRSYAEAERGLIERLSHHGAAAEGASPPAETAVCIHSGRMVTVSYSVVCLARGVARYLHADGRPCETSPMDYSGLLEGETAALRP